MMGIWRSALASSFCRSSPLSPGSFTSSTRQPGTTVRALARNSCADAKVSTRKPADRIKPSSDSRTERSSSTTPTGGYVSLMWHLPSTGDRQASTYPSIVDPPHSVTPTSFHPQSRLDRIQQSIVAEGLEQVIHCPAPQSARPQLLVSMSSDEDDRQVRMAAHQKSVQLEPAHPRHAHIEDQAVRLAHTIRAQEFLG